MKSKKVWKPLVWRQYLKIKITINDFNFGTCKVPQCYIQNLEPFQCSRSAVTTAGCRWGLKKTRFYYVINSLVVCSTVTDKGPASAGFWGGGVFYKYLGSYLIIFTLYVASAITSLLLINSFPFQISLSQQEIRFCYCLLYGN